MSKIIKGSNETLLHSLKIEKKGISFDSSEITPLVELDVNDTLYKTFKKVALRNENKICISNPCGQKFTYSEILRMADDFASALSIKGVKKGDIVALPIKSSIEEAICLIGINKIGAVSKWIDSNKNENEIFSDLNDENIKFIVSSATIKDKVTSFINKTDYNKDNLVFVNETFFSADSEFYKLLQTGEDYFTPAVSYKKSDPALMITSSGSTGLPKVITHSSFSVNSAVKKLTYTDFPIKDNIITVVVPPYIGLGLITSLYTALLCEAEARIISTDYANPFVMANYIKENQDTLSSLPEDKKILLFGAPMYYKALAMIIDEIDDLSFIGAIMAAGSKMDEKILIEIDNKLKSKGCTVPVCNAYGQNEYAGGITYNTISNNRRGSAGKVAYATRIMIVDTKTQNEAKPNEIGKVVEQSDSEFLYYYKNLEATKNSVFIDKDGEKWFDTKDLGCIDEDGFLHILDRESRAIIRYDHKIALAKIEERLLKHRLVEEAYVVKVEVDGPVGKDQAPFAFVCIPDEYKVFGEEIIDDFQNGPLAFSPLELPVRVEVVDKDFIPYKNNKVNYLKLEEVASMLMDESQYDGVKVKTKGAKSYKK